MKNFIKASVMLVVVTMLVSITIPVSATTTIPHLITEPIEGFSIERGETFFTTNFTIDYQQGEIIFSKFADGTGNTKVDDAVEIVVTRPDGSQVSFVHTYSAPGCFSSSNFPPEDLTSLFGVGINQISVRLYDVCGLFAGSSSMYLVNLNAEPPPIVIFLEGIGSSLTQNEIDAMQLNCADDPEFGIIKQELLSHGFRCDNFLRFSYLGGTFDAQGVWQPTPYECGDTGYRLGDPINHLAILIRGYKLEHPEARFVLIGHSLGGLVAIETIDGISSDPSLGDAVDAVIAIDSPLNYLSWQNLRNIRRNMPAISRAKCEWGQILFSSQVAQQISNIRNETQRQNMRDDRERIVADAQNRGTHFMTIGNASDCLWYLPHCGFSGRNTGWDDDRDSMIIQNAEVKMLYQLGTQGCDLSALLIFATGFECLGDTHGIALQHSTVVDDIVSFVLAN